MRTQSDLRDAVRERADRAPSPNSDLLAGRVPGSRSNTVSRVTARRTPAIAAAVLVTAGVATGAVVVASSIGGGTRTPTHPHHGATHHPTALHDSVPHAVAPLPSLIGDTVGVAYDGPGAVEYDQSTEAQYVQLRGGELLRDVTLYNKGLFSPKTIEHRRAVTVNGQPGFVGEAYPWFGDDLSHTDPAHPGRGGKWAHPLPILAWKIAPGQWVSVCSDRPGEGTLPGLRAIARHVHAVNRPVRTPIKVGYLPGGQKLSNVNYYKPYGGYGSASLLGFRRNDRFGYWSWDISVAHASTSTGSGGGTNVHSIDPQVSRTIGKYVVTVQTLGAISKAEAKKVLASITLAKAPGRPNRSWFDLAHALP